MTPAGFDSVLAGVETWRCDRHRAFRLTPSSGVTRRCVKVWQRVAVACGRGKGGKSCVHREGSFKCKQIPPSERGRGLKKGRGGNELDSFILEGMHRAFKGANTIELSMCGH